MATTPANLTLLIVIWLVYSILMTAGLGWIRSPKAKLIVYRLGALGAWPLGLWTVWQFPGTMRDLVTAGITFAVIVALNIGLVRVCYRCSTIAHPPRSLTPAAYCSTCGAPITSLDTSTHTSV